MSVKSAVSAKSKQIKKHFKDHQVVYICTIGGLIVGAAGTYFVTRTNADNELAQKFNQVGFRNEINAVIIQLIERSTPSKPVHLVGTDRYFSSLNEAARETGHSLTMLSRQINGHIPDIKGDVFELLESAA